MTKWHKEGDVYLYDHDECTRLKVFKYNDKRGWRGYVLHITEYRPDEPPYYSCVKYLNLDTRWIPEAKIKALDALQKYLAGEL